MRIRYLATAVPLLLAGSLAATAPGTSQAAGGDEPTPKPPTASSAQQLAVFNACKGGAQKRAFSGGTAAWFSTSSSTTVAGTTYTFKGPKKKKDTLFVTVTAPQTYVTPGDAGRVRVLLDGADMKPGSLGGEYFYESTNWSAFAGQYCARVGKGWHEVELVLESSGTDDEAYLWNPVLHAEVAE